MTWKTIAMALAAIVTVTVSAAPAFACGPYGSDHTPFMNVEWSAEDVSDAQKRLDVAIQSQDAQSIRSASIDLKYATQRLVQARTMYMAQHSR